MMNLEGCYIRKAISQHPLKTPVKDLCEIMIRFRTLRWIVPSPSQANGWSLLHIRHVPDSTRRPGILSELVLDILRPARNFCGVIQSLQANAW
jgi:nitrogen fixation protein